MSEPLELQLTVAPKGKKYETRLYCRELGIDAGPYPLRLPLDDKILAELRWYLEQYPRWPVGPDVERARRIEAQLARWGRDLFAALVTPTPDAARVWTQFRLAEPDRPRLLTLDCTEPEVLRQPWELLADEEGHCFALGIGFRRRLHKAQAATTRAFDLPVRVLMVIARPEDEDVAFIDPRASSQALLAALEPLGDAAAVEFLPEGTLAVLDRRLTDRHAPPVHVVHFDGHGVYDQRQGLGYLIFEDAQGRADFVDAERLGTLLARSGIPLIVLDACQSAHTDAENPFSSVAPRLIQAGIGSVAAMQYSVLVPASKQFFAAFYTALTEGETIGQAMDAGRRALLRDEFRFMLHHPDGSDRPITLRDWFLPALYQQAADPAPFFNAEAQRGRGAEGGEGKKASQRESESASQRADATPLLPTPLLGDFPAPRYGFIGRAYELWQLERLFRERRIVILHAFGGQGKTALAAEAAAWLTRKGRFARAVFLSFEQGGAADWALTQLGRLLLGNDFSSLDEAGRLPALRAALAAAPTLLIWDNFESVLPDANAALPGPDLRALLDLGAALVTPAPHDPSPLTRLLVTTRDADLPHEAFRPGATTARLLLKGLMKWEALELAGAVLDAEGAPRPPRLELERLLDFLGEHPLSIQLVTPHLREYPDVQTVIERFETLYPGFTAGKAKARNESLEVSLHFSLDRLSETARARIAALGVFEGGAFEMQILMVTGLKPSEWLPARAELVRAGLATVEMESPFSIETAEGDFGGHFLRFHPTLTPALRRRLDAAALPALETAYWQAYYQLANHLYRTDETAPQVARAVAQRELPNLRRGVALALQSGDVAAAVDFAARVELFLDVLGRWRERAVMMEAVEKAVEKEEGSTGPLTKAEYLLQSSRGERLLDAGHAREAETLFRGLLARMGEAQNVKRETSGEEVGGYELALTLGRLGRSLEAQGRPREAEAEYHRALAVLEQLLGGGALPTTRLTTADAADAFLWHQTGAAHTDLADVLMLQGRYPEARAQYEAALKIDEALGDERGAAVDLGQLGTLALQEGDFAGAERQYRDVIRRFHALGEPHTEAMVWHQLGMVYETAAEREAGQGVGSKESLLQQAEEAYRQSLQLKEAIGDQAGAARTANQLAMVARMAGRPADAARWYRRAIAWDKETGNPKDLAIDYNNLAGLLLTAARGEYGAPPPAGLAEGDDLLAEAESLARQAIAIDESIGDPSIEIWKDYNVMAGIAEARGDPTAAQAWRRKERAAYVAFPGHWANLSRQWGQIVQAVAQASRLRIIPADLDAALQRKAEHGWTAVAAALRDLLAGARDADALADKHNLDNEDYLIVCKTLEAIHESATNARREADEEAQARALMAALEAWVETPAGQSALRELQAQGAGKEALVMGLLQRFMAAQAGGGKANK